MSTIKEETTMALESTDRRLHFSNKDNHARPQMRPKKERAMPIEITDIRHDRSISGKKGSTAAGTTRPLESPADSRQCNRPRVRVSTSTPAKESRRDLTNSDSKGRPQVPVESTHRRQDHRAAAGGDNKVRPQTARVCKAMPVDRNQMRPRVRVSTSPTPLAKSENKVRSKLPSRVRVIKAMRLDGLEDRDDEVLPQLPSWGHGESPRGRHRHGLLALLDRDPTYQFGYAFSCGYEELEMDGFDSDASGSKSKVYVMRQPTEMGSNFVKEAANGNAHPITLTTVDSPSYGLSRAGTREKERLVEVFSFRFNNRNYCGDIYGAIRVMHTCGYVYGSYIFHRLQGDPKCIGLYDDTLSFVGPACALYCSDLFWVMLELKDKDVDLFPFHEERNFELMERQLDAIEYGKLMSKVFHGKYGPATLYYTVFDDAVEAHVKVEHFQGDLVYGSIFASYGHYNYSIDEERMKYCKSVLFYKPSSDYVKLKLLKALPITRVVAVPTSSSLVIEAGLWNYTGRNPGDCIADGTASFPAKAPGEKSVMDIKGGIGFARVTVVWKSALSFWQG